LIVALVPAVEDSEMVRLRFQPALDALSGTNIPVLDLLGTFDGVPEIERMRVYWYDGHPNVEGHQRMADNFLAKAKADPVAWRILTGSDQKQ
jgi:hypothetical protein